MELALQQKLVARLVTDREFRESFFANPAKVAAHEGLTVAAEGLAQMHHEQLRQFARLLRTRRLAQVSVQLPLTRLALGMRFADLFRNYCIHPQPGKRPFEDALGFAKYLEGYASAEQVNPEWALSIAQYEAAKIEATWLDRHLTIRFLPHAVRRLATMLKAGNIPPGSYQRLSVAIWWRATESSRLKHWLW